MQLTMGKSVREAFGAALAQLGESRPDIVVIDGDVGNSTHTQMFGKKFPERFFNVGIAESNMVGVAAGLATSGKRAWCSSFAAFVMCNAYDQLRMSVAFPNLDVKVVGTHAGISIGEDGPSQMGLEDLAMMRALNDSTVLYPCDANQTADLVAALSEREGVSYLRTSRGSTPVIYPPGTEFPIGGSVVLRRSENDSVTLVAAGVTVHEALTAADRLSESGITARVIDAYSVKPIDGDTLATAATETGRLVVVEDHRPEGGLGEAVVSALAERGATVVLRHLAVRMLPGSATPEQQRRVADIDADAIVAAARELTTSDQPHI
jgi:transketolase